MTEVIIRRARAQDAAWIVARHAAVYAEDDGFDGTFGPLVARILDRFFADHDPARAAGWIAQRGVRRLGCIFCVPHDGCTAKLRLFLLEPDARGQGLGKRLLATCTGFAKAAGYTDMTLWTHESHRAACALYAASGWTLAASKPVRSFGCDLVEQSWTRPL